MFKEGDQVVKFEEWEGCINYLFDIVEIFTFSNYAYVEYGNKKYMYAVIKNSKGENFITETKELLKIESCPNV